ncbi:MAG: hypothetical protein ABI856_17325 [Nitrospira sp.]
MLQTSFGGDATCPSSRLALMTAQAEVPLSRTYAAGTGEEYETLAKKIRAVTKMGPTTSDIVLDSVRAAAERGRTIEAVRLLRLHKRMTLAEANAFINRLK